MSILLTGASGYLAQFVIEELARGEHASTLSIAACYWTTPLVLPPAVTSAFASVSTHSVNLTDDAAVASLLDSLPSIDVVIHTAAMTSIDACEKAPEDAAATNCPTAFLEALRDRTSSTAFLYTSTDIIFDGEAAPYAETAPGDASPLNTYGRTKLAFESALAARWSGRYAILRLSNMLGPPSPFAPRRSKFLQWLDGALGGDDDSVTLFAEEVRSFVAVTDVAALLVLLAVRHLDGTTAPSDAVVVHCGGVEGLSRAALARRLAALRDHTVEGRIVETTRAAAAAAKGVALAFASPCDVTMDSTKMRSLLHDMGDHYAAALSTEAMLERAFR